MQLVNLLKGYKTYLASAVAVVTGLSAYLHGASSLSTALTSVPGLLVYLGAIAAALRAGVAKAHAEVQAVEAAVARIEDKLPAPVKKVVAPKVAAVEAAVDKAVAKV
jgi:hypothetical protein